MNLELSARPTQLNPRRLGLLLSIGLVLATLLSSVSAETGVVPLSVPPLVQLGLFGIYFLSLLACLRHKNKLGQLSFLACLGTYGLLYLNYNLERPASCFLVFCLLGFAAMASLRLKAHEIQNISFEQFFHQLLLHTSLGCSGLWLYVFPFRQAADDISLVLPLCASLLVAVLIVLHSTFQERKRRWIVRLLSFLFLLAFFGILWLGEDWTLATLSHRSGLFPACGLFLSLPTKQIRERLNASIEAIFFHPEGSILVTFLALCCIGTFLLILPSSSRGESELSLIDAAFTAVSAVCVTGLIVKDTALDFSLSGQIIILGLIQTGGLGIMFLSALALFFIGQRVSLRQESALFSVLGQRLKGEIRAILKRVLLLTFFIEALGASILTLIFKQMTEDWGTALWQGVFTAISAFCNAGFALHSQNLIPFRENHLLVHTVAVLIIL